MKYGKDILKVIGVLAILFFAVMGWHFSDVAEKPFWWKFWSIAGVVSFLSLFIGWLYLVKKDKDFRNGNK